MTPAALVLCVALLPVPVASARSARPDLREQSVSRPPSPVKRGSHFTVTDRVQNRGHKIARSSTTAFYLAGTNEFAVRCCYRVGSHKVPALKPGKSFRARARLTVPSAQEVGKWYLLTCADDRAKVRESNEKNNCRFAGSRISVEAEQRFGFPVENGVPGLQGSGTLSFGASSPDRVKWQVSFNRSVAGFDLFVPGGYAEGKMQSPEARDCLSSDHQETHNGKAYYKIECYFSGTGTAAGGELLTSPPPSSGMGGYLYGYEGAGEDTKYQGPFQVTGP